MARDLFPLVPFKLRGSMARELHMISAYSVYAFIKRDIGLYMTLQNMFVFFILDYLAVMGLFAWTGYYAAEWLKRFSVRKAK